jgi:hypothetical protein
LVAGACQFSACLGTNNSGCEKHIREKILCGFKITLEPEKKSIYADKVIPGFIVERTPVSIQLDANGKVATVSVTTGLVGPLSNRRARKRGTPTTHYVLLTVHILRQKE